MKTPVILALISMVFYAIGNNVLEQKLSKYNVFGIMICYFAMMIIIAVICFTIGKMCTVAADNGVTSSIPATGKDLLICFMLALVLFVGEDCYIGAYTNGKGDVITISCVTVMFPVVASAIKFGINRTLPSPWHIAGFILAATAVICISKGSNHA